MRFILLLAISFVYSSSPRQPNFFKPKSDYTLKKHPSSELVCENEKKQKTSPPRIVIIDTGGYETIIDTAYPGTTNVPLRTTEEQSNKETLI